MMIKLWFFCVKQRPLLGWESLFTVWPGSPAPLNQLLPVQNCSFYFSSVWRELQPSVLGTTFAPLNSCSQLCIHRALNEDHCIIPFPSPCNLAALRLSQFSPPAALAGAFTRSETLRHCGQVSGRLRIAKWLQRAVKCIVLCSAALISAVRLLAQQANLMW